MTVLGIIPARYGSTRFEGKPLALINGISMINRVYNQSILCDKFDKVVVATDNTKIVDECNNYDIPSILTSTECKNGTERCYEAYHSIGMHYDIVINIQGDEPIIDPKSLLAVIDKFNDKNVEISTIYKKISTIEQYNNPNIIKIVKDINNKALYFSRSSIPNSRDGEINTDILYKHIGIYGYRSNILNKIVNLTESSLEKSEMLEQLRWLENGYSIHLSEVKSDSYSVDVPSDIDIIEQILNKNKL